MKVKIKFSISFFVLSITLLFSISQSSAQMVSCISGTGRRSNINGPSICSQNSTAKILFPEALAQDKDGNIYIADTGNHSIRKLSKDGIVTTIAGSGSMGSADGIGSAASFNYPQGIAVDKDGNIYVSDTNNHRIRKITANGTVTTFAGDIQGNKNGTGSGASFNNPAGLLLDENAGILYVADRGNYKIRKISLTGIVTSFVGAGVSGYVDAVGVAAKFNIISGIVMDASGNIFAPDCFNVVIRKITPDGSVSTFAGSYLDSGSENGLGAAAKFKQPYGIAIDPNNNLYVSDVILSNIRKITPQGLVSSFVGTPPTSAYPEELFDGVNEAAHFFSPLGLLYHTDGNLYVADTKNNAIRKATKEGIVTTVAGSSNSYNLQDGIGIAASYRLPTGVLVNSDGVVFVGDGINNQIRKIDLNGMVSVYAGSGIKGNAEGPASTARLSNPTNMVMDANGNMFVVDSDNNKIRKITPDGIVSTFAGSGINGSADGIATVAQFNRPYGIAIDRNGNLFVTDVANSKIRKITPNGVVSTYAGSETGNNDGTLNNATFFTLYSLTFDKNGTMYVTDNNRIRKITIDGTVTTLAGGGTGDSDGLGASAKFRSLDGIVCDVAGNIYVSDKFNYKIRKVTPEGLVSTYAGSGLNSSLDGIGTAAAINIPAGLSIDKFDNIFAIDFFGSKILKISPPESPITTPIISRPNTSIQTIIYPNPVVNDLHIDVADAKCYILNSTGEIIHETQIENGFINVKMLNPGLYLLKISSENNFTMQKFIKE